MSFFNDAQIEAMRTGKYYCSQCGALMQFEDEMEDILVCLKCGNSVDLDHYGFESEEEYETLYPTEEEVLGISDDDEEDEDDCLEPYDEVCGELSDND